MDTMTSMLELLKFLAFVVVIIGGILHQLRDSGSVDWTKTSSSLGEVLDRAEKLHRDGHLQNVQEATEFALDRIKTIRGHKLSSKVTRKIREHVKLRFEGAEE